SRLLTVFLPSRRRPRSSLVPYTTLFRSPLREGHRVPAGAAAVGTVRRRVDRLRPTAQDQLAGNAGGAPGSSFRGGVRESPGLAQDRKSTRLNSSHVKISYAVFCLKKKNT